MDELRLIPVRGVPEIRAGEDVAKLLAPLLARLARPGDVLVVTHKVLSKAEGRLVDLTEVQPSALAESHARAWGKDPRQVEVVLRESGSILRMEGPVIISRTRHGLVCANAGVDKSNVPGQAVCLLPEDPDASAGRLYQALEAALGFSLPVVISDSFGRPWRLGIVNVAIGLAGMAPFTDHRGRTDAHGYRLEASLMATADAVAAAAELVMGKTDGVPAALVRGLELSGSTGCAAELIRPGEQDLFR
ncbi:MAG: hypothetical protein AMXMBFR33_27760 [Candidatus Xenobia bacterium]